MNEVSFQIEAAERPKVTDASGEECDSRLPYGAYQGIWFRNVVRVEREGLKYTFDSLGSFIAGGIDVIVMVSPAGVRVIGKARAE